MGEQEVELKLRLTPEVAAKLRRSGIVRSLRQGRARNKSLAAVYYDTPDLSLKSMGVALRVRQEGGTRVQTLKTANGVAPGLHDRTEWNSIIAGKGPDLAKIHNKKLKARFRRDNLHRRIKPVFRTNIKRTSWILDYRGSEIELCLDEGRIAAGRRGNDVCEAELELIEGKPERLLQLAMEIGEALPVFLDTRTKSARGYDLFTGDKPRPRKARPVKLKPRMEIWEAFSRIMNEALAQLLANEWPVRVGKDPEGIHQARVAVRRMRAALWMFRRHLPAEQVAAVREELAWLQRGFGPARDWDVFIDETLGPLRRHMPAEKALATLATQAEAAHERAYAAAFDVLDSRRFTRLVLSLQLWVSGAPPHKSLTKPIRKPASRIIAKAHKTVLDAAGDDIGALSEAELHALRIKIKKLRYTVEFLGTLFKKKPVGTQAAVARDLQDCLGGLNDSVVAHHLIDMIETDNGVVPERAKAILEGWLAARIDAGLMDLNEMWGRFTSQPKFW